MRSVKVIARYIRDKSSGSDLEVYDVATGEYMHEVQAFAFACSIDDEFLVGDITLVSPDGTNERVERVKIESVDIQCQGTTEVSNG